MATPPRVAIIIDRWFDSEFEICPDMTKLVFHLLGELSSTLYDESDQVFPGFLTAMIFCALLRFCDGYILLYITYM